MPNAGAPTASTVGQLVQANNTATPTRLPPRATPPPARKTPCFFCRQGVTTAPKGSTPFRTDTFQTHFAGAGGKRRGCKRFRHLLCEYDKPTQEYANIDALGNEVLRLDPILWLENFEFYQFGHILSKQLRAWAEKRSPVEQHNFAQRAMVKVKEMSAARFKEWIRWWPEAWERMSS